MKTLPLAVVFTLMTAALICHGADEATDGVISLDEGLMSPKTATFLETGEGTTVKMSVEERVQFKADFVKLASQIRTPNLRSNVMIAERMATDALDRDDMGGVSNAGMTLIFDKLDELSAEITEEQEKEDNWLAGEKTKFTTTKQGHEANIIEFQKVISDNKAANVGLQTTIETQRTAYREAREREVGATGSHTNLLATESTRTTETATHRIEVDDRNAALDVLIEALFLVCERFNRYKNTDLCMQIKSQPDVTEPDRYETKEPAEAETETDELHADGSAFATGWAQQQLIDAGKENVMCPETPDDCPAANKSGIPLLHGVQITAGDEFKDSSTIQTRAGLCAEKCGALDDCKSFSYNINTQYCDIFTTEGTQVASEEHVSGVKPTAADAVASGSNTTLTNEMSVLELQEQDDAVQMQAMHRLKQLAKVSLPEKYQMPLQELLVAVQTTDEDGSLAGAARAKTIVEIIIEIIEECRKEQLAAKEAHRVKLDGWYADARLEISNIIALQVEQETAHLAWQNAKKTMKDNVAQNAQQYALIATERAALVQNQIEYDQSEREHGVQTSLREEDRENLVKLRSLLRALYDKTVPAACARVGGVLCTDKIAGWCVFEERLGHLQRCSCNYGFYGVACQLKMCPGRGDVLYKATASPGVCSNSALEQRGDSAVNEFGCDFTMGDCHCAPDFYHGPDRKCEYRHAPPSKYPDPAAPTPNHLALDNDGVIDELCSGHGTVNKKTGICTCDPDWWGPPPNEIQIGGGCEEMKCPGGGNNVAAGLKFPRTSDAACNRRGTCSPYTGLCACSSEHDGVMCELESCPSDCMNGENGSCDTNEGKCNCNTDSQGRAYGGPACERIECPADCGGSNQGFCDTNDGHCVCKMGYSGDECQRSSRCTTSNLNTAATNWYTIWDTPGWIVCPEGQLLYGLKRRNCQALSCIDSGSCAAGCEGTTMVYQIRHCYHDLGWYNSFDMAGWSRCLSDYFVAGLYRSCESLYCLQIGKCCSMKDVRWAGGEIEPSLPDVPPTGACTEAGVPSAVGNPGGIFPMVNFKTGGDATIGNANGFITGFYRTKGHDLQALEKASFCEFVRNY
jgi:hypothetical protein